MPKLEACGIIKIVVGSFLRVTAGIDNFKRDEQFCLLQKHVRQSENQASIRWAATSGEFFFIFILTISKYFVNLVFHFYFFSLRNPSNPNLGFYSFLRRPDNATEILEPKLNTCLYFLPFCQNKSTSNK